MRASYTNEERSTSSFRLHFKAVRLAGPLLPLLLIFLLPSARAATEPQESKASPVATMEGVLGTAAAINSAPSMPNVIVFSPNAVTLSNPSGTNWTTKPAGPTAVSINLTVYDSTGTVTTPSRDRPLHVHVYGAPDGVISPIDQVLTSGTTTTSTIVTFQYDGGSFPNNMELAAWMDDSAGGSSLGTTLFVPETRRDCTGGSSASDLYVTSKIPSEIQVKAVVGADYPPEADFHNFTIDTGSLGVLVTKSDLIMGPQVHGPGAPGEKFYNSSGLIFSGYYYLAPVSIELTDHSFVKTNPILVLAVDHVKCDSSESYKGRCHLPKNAGLHYLGVGFDRNSTTAGDLFDSPSQNAFLELTDLQNGNDINQGYILSKEGVTLGITADDSSEFTFTRLDANTTVAGDWGPLQGCYGFPKLSGSPQFCGSLLLDLGIKQMYLDLPFGDRPGKTFDKKNYVPSKIRMNIQAGVKGQPPAMSYGFDTIQPPDQPGGDTPAFVQWINKTDIFVNTGRRALMKYSYLYLAGCGYVGFRPVADR